MDVSKVVVFLSEREVSFDDNFPKKLCQPCFRKIKNILEFRSLTKKSLYSQELLLAEAKVKRGRSSQQTADSPSSSQQSKKSNVLERNVQVSLFNESSEVQPVERMTSQFRPIAPAITDNTRRVLPVYLRNDQEKPTSSKKDGQEEESVAADIMKHSGLRKYQAKSLPLNSKPFPFLPSCHVQDIRILRFFCSSSFFLF